MVRIDRGFIGVLLIAVVISTVFMGFISVEKAEKGIEIIKNKYPARISKYVQEKHTFVTNVIARKDYEEVKLVFSVLRVREPVFVDENITKKPGVNLEEIAAEILHIKTCLYAYKTSPVGFGREILEFNANGTDVEALLYDFGEVITGGQPLPDISSAPTSYLLWMDDEGNLTYYQGNSDFFFSRNASIDSLIVSYNDKETTYRSTKEVTGSVDIPTIAEGPKMGTVVYENVEKNDRMYVRFVIDSLSSPKHNGMIQLVRVYGNDELVTFAANSITP